MIPVNLSELKLDPENEAQLRKACDELRSIISLKEKYAYIDKHDTLWRATLAALAKLTSNSELDCKCWYCECDGSAGFSFHIDHYRPKGRVKNKGYKKDQYEPGYWWLAFEPENYRIACQRCNSGSGKNDQFPLAANSARAIYPGGESLEDHLLLDPCSPTDPDLLIFSQDGNVHPAPNAVDAEKTRAETSISVYDLRAQNKREGRRKVWQDCNKEIATARQAYDRLQEAMLMPAHEKAVKTKQFRDACGEVKKMTWRNARFSATAKYCILEYYKVEKYKGNLENRMVDLEWLLRLL